MVEEAGVSGVETKDRAEANGGKRGWMRRLAPLIGLVLVMALFFGLGFDRYVSLDLLRNNRELLTGFVADHYLLAALAFIAVYAMVTGLSVPGAAVLTLSGGFLFGSLGGTVCAVIGATTGATALFWVARTAFGDALRVRAGKAWSDARRVSPDAFNFLLFLRLVPAFPFFIVNLVPVFSAFPQTYIWQR